MLDIHNCLCPNIAVVCLSFMMLFSTKAIIVNWRMVTIHKFELVHTCVVNCQVKEIDRNFRFAPPSPYPVLSSWGFRPTEILKADAIQDINLYIYI